jgi:hypothetical protein
MTMIIAIGGVVFAIRTTVYCLRLYLLLGLLHLCFPYLLCDLVVLVVTLTSTLDVLIIETM